MRKPLLRKPVSFLSPPIATRSPSTETQCGGGGGENKPLLQKSVFVKVDTLKLGISGHTLIVKVLDANTVLNKKPRNPTFRGPHIQNTKIVECFIGDEIGTILFTAHNDQVDLTKPGNTVVLRNAKIDVFKGSMRLAVDNIHYRDPCWSLIVHDVEDVERFSKKPLKTGEKRRVASIC